MSATVTQIIDEKEINEALDRAAPPEGNRVREILDRARGLKGLSFEDVTALAAVDDPEQLQEMFATARWVKEEIYGPRLVLFAPLYVSNYCKNQCLYCAFAAGNKEVRRKALTQEEVAEEVRAIIGMGHKRILLVAGEAYPERRGLDYVIECIETIYKTKSGRGEVRRVNANIAPLSVEDFRRLKAADIGTYQIFQETYHRETYARMHPRGPKADYDWRVSAMHRAMEAGIDDVGIGPLFGLYDWRFELLALMQHIRSLEEHFGVGPHTISVPRLEPAVGTPFATSSPYQMSDADFLKLIAILRLTVPYTGMVMSTRENPQIRRETFRLGISQISAASRTDPGGYTQSQDAYGSGQFQVGDHRPMDEVIREICGMGFIPSFCTACYRTGRTGHDFMDLAKPGEIKYHCGPNAMATFEEYLIDYADDKTRAAGESLIQMQLGEMDEGQRMLSSGQIDQVKAGKRDVFL